MFCISNLLLVIGLIFTAKKEKLSAKYFLRIISVINLEKNPSLLQYLKLHVDRRNEIF